MRYCDISSVLVMDTMVLHGAIDSSKINETLGHIYLVKWVTITLVNYFDSVSQSHHVKSSYILSNVNSLKFVYLITESIHS